MKSIDLPPYAPTLMESTRAIGYSIEAAIADIIDNSLTASAAHIYIDFFPVGEAYISLLDDGIGMTSDCITVAMQYGSRNPLEERAQNDLGRYGLGLKTASLSQCRKLTVISKRDGIVSGRQWDLDHIIQAENWSLLVLDEDDMPAIPNFEKFNAQKKGTLVVWQNLDKFGVGENDISAAFKNKIELVREHLSLIFHRYLAGEPGLKKVEIKVNDRPIEPKDPFLSKKSTQLMDDETIYIRGEKVVVKPYILPHVSKLTEDELKELGGKEGLRRQQGFYVYRNKRLLIWGTWFRLMRQGDLSKLARVQVDIPNSLDDLWTLDIKKSTATPLEDVRVNLAHTIKNIADGSKRTWTHRSKKEVGDAAIHLWNRVKTRDGGIIYEINRDHPLVDELIRKYPNAKCGVEILLTQIEDNIPLNSLYVDLTSDEKVTNDNEHDGNSIVQLLRSILDGCDTDEQKKTLFASLILSDPFCDYEEEICSTVKKGVLL